MIPSRSDNRKGLSLREGIIVLVLRQRILHNRCQRVDEQRRGIERFSTDKLDAVFFCLLASADLDIVEDLQVVGQKLDRGDQYMGVSRLFEFWHQVGKVRSEPLLFCMPRALI